MIAPVFGSAVYLYGGWPFVAGAWREAKSRLPGMMTIIAPAITVSFAFSLAVTLGYPGMPLWEELATLVTIMLLGHWIEMRSITQTQGAPAELAKLLPNSATRVVGDGSDGRIEEVPLSALGDGYVVLVRPGASAPASGATGLRVAPRALPLTGSMVDVIRRRCAFTPAAARSGRFRADRSEQCVVVTPAATAGRCRPPPAAFL